MSAATAPQVESESGGLSSGASLPESLSKLQELLAIEGDERIEEATVLVQSLLDNDTSSNNGADADADADAPLSKELRETLFETLLKCHLHAGNYAQVLEWCNSTTNNNNNNNSSSSYSHTIATIHAYALYRLNDYAQALKVSKAANKEMGTNNQMSSSFLVNQHVRAQALYRLYRTKEAFDSYQIILEECNKEKSNNKHQKGNRSDTRSIQVEVLTNALAVAQANATPYVPMVGNDTTAHIMKQANQRLQSQTDNSEYEDYSYDLAYNLATCQMISGQQQQQQQSSRGSVTTTRQLLEKSRQACTSTLETDGCDDIIEIQKEVSPIVANLTCLDLWNNRGNGMDGDGANVPNKQALRHFPLAIQSVWKCHNAFTAAASAPSSDRSNKAALKLLPESPDPTWTALQRRIFYYNLAVFACNANQIQDCRRALKHLSAQASVMTSTATSSSTTSSSLVTYPVPSKQDEAWWRARVDVLEAYCLVKNNQSDQAVPLLQKRLDLIRKNNSSSSSSNSSSSSGSTYIEDQTWTYVQLHLHELQHATTGGGTAQDKMELLHSLPTSIKEKQAFVATLAALHHQMGDTEQATELLLTSGDDRALADFSMSQGNYEQAASLYETLAMNATGNDNEDQKLDGAQWVQALLHFDAEQAKKIWNEMKLKECDDDDDDAYHLLDGEALEEQELPRVVSKTKTARISSSTMGTKSSSNTTNKKSHTAVLRRRARLAKEYVASKESTGTSSSNHAPKNADPERWIPKHERSGRRRGRRGHHHNHGGNNNNKSSQGGASEKDAAKLDAAARAQAKRDGVDLSAASGGGRSTAHMSVAGNSKRGGGGKKK